MGKFKIQKMKKVIAYVVIYVLGIISGVLINASWEFFKNPSPTLEEVSQSSYIDAINPTPHYEFSNEKIPYMEYKSITYKIYPPFYSFKFNSEGKIKLPPRI